MAGEKFTKLDVQPGLAVQIGLNAKKGMIVLEYSEPCKWVEMTAEEARAFAAFLFKKAADLELLKGGANVQKVGVGRG